MPARRKSLSRLALTGSLKKNPGRYADRASAPALGPIGYCPKFLSAPERAIWRYIVKVAPPGALTSADAFTVELAAKLMHRVRTDAAAKASEVAVLISLLGKLGLTPADRAKLDLPASAPTDETDPWSQFDRPAKPNGVQ